MAAMAYHGQWQELFRFIAEQIDRYTGIRDFIEGERMIQGFFMAYLNVHDHFRTLSEVEFNRRYCDLVLLPSAQYPDMPWGFLLELKYLKRQDSALALEREVQKAVAEAQKQIDDYVSGHTLPTMLRRNDGKGDLKMGYGVIVFHGWEMVYCQNYQPISKNVQPINPSRPLST